MSHWVPDFDLQERFGYCVHLVKLLLA
jgi:hypothetical protein